MTMRSSGGLKAAGWCLAGGLFLFQAAALSVAAAEKGQWVRLAPKTPKQPDATDLNKVLLPIGCPTAVRGVLAVDRCTGDLFISACYYGNWKSTDHGQTFARIDNGQIHDSSPFREYALQISPDDGKKIAIFNANANPGNYGYAYAYRSHEGLVPPATCGLSTDGGATWQIFAPVNFPPGTVKGDLIFDTVCAVDWKSSAVLADHRRRLYYSPNAGKDWQMLARGDDWGAHGVGVLDAQVLVVSEYKTERSEDGGKTWTKVSDLAGAGPVQCFKGTAYWWSNKGEIITSKDTGKTWTPLASTPKNPKRGPYFGKDEKHIVVMTTDGFSETTDGGQTWKLAAPNAPSASDVMPRGANVPTAGFDPVGNIFYYLPTHGYLEDIWRFER
jgi:hypothetical protein